VFVEVLDENDHTPLTSEPVYWVSVAENSPPRTAVARITALDGDLVGSGGSGKMIYHLKAGNPQSLFDIDPNTGTYYKSLSLLSVHVSSYATEMTNKHKQKRKNKNKNTRSNGRRISYRIMS
jgi:hypothetical protein